MMQKSLLFLATLLFVGGCKQSDPTFTARENDVLTFSGRQWQIKKGFDGPGPNTFSNHPNDIWVDDQGYLHLTITRRDGNWVCTEVGGLDYTGYGTYVWTIQGNPVFIDKSVVVGLFTWDYSSFKEQANSEVDIEFSKWNEDTAQYTLQYGVQPIHFGPYNPERSFKPIINNNQIIGVSTHAFTWTDTLITYQSWEGGYQNGTPIASWTFDLSNPPRIKYENGQASNPIVIPAPGDSTHPRMNLWLLTGAAGPTIPIRHEIIIRDFQYLPL